MVELISGRIGCWLRRHQLFFRAGELRLQGVSDRFRDIALDRKNVREFAIVDFRPKMRVGQGIDQLHIDADLIARLLHAAFQDVQDAELFRDVRQVFWRTFEFLRRRPRDHFQVRVTVAGKITLTGKFKSSRLGQRNLSWQSFSNRGSPRSASKSGSSRNKAGVSGDP